MTHLACFMFMKEEIPKIFWYFFMEEDCRENKKWLKHWKAAIKEAKLCLIALNIGQNNCQGRISFNWSRSQSLCNWTKFLFGYCDGSLRQGYTRTPIKYKDAFMDQLLLDPISTELTRNIISIMLKESSWLKCLLEESLFISGTII